MTSVLEDSVPAPGQLVTVRNRQWIATEVDRGEVSSSDPNVFSAKAAQLAFLCSPVMLRCSHADDDQDR